MRQPRSWAGIAALGALAITAVSAYAGGTLPFERARMQDILKRVAKDVESNYYDPKLTGLDWPALTEQAKQKIAQAESVGQMITAIFALVDKLHDSHTVFLPPNRAARISFGFHAKPYGDKIFVNEVYKDSPAAKAGLQSGDQILTANGFNAERQSWLQMMRYMRVLQPVTAFDLLVKRGNEPPQKITIPADVEQKSVVATEIHDDADWSSFLREQSVERQKYYREGQQYESYYYSEVDTDKIGFLHFRNFIGGFDWLEKYVDQIKDTKATIVDLRGNSGGDVKLLGFMADHFETGPSVIAQYIGRDKTEKIEAAPRKPILSGPLFILVDSTSMSASEIFARHFQASGRAKIIGDHTPGYVEVARTFSEHTGVDTMAFYGVEISIARLVMTGGERLEKVGVTPDVPCLPTAEDLREHVDSCRHVAEAMARKALGLPEKEDKPAAASPTAKS